jgi:hypothetical protein
MSSRAYDGSARRGDPTLWWSGYDVVLGDPVGARYLWQGVHRRDFTNGMVLLSGPGSRSRTL